MKITMNIAIVASFTVVTSAALSGCSQVPAACQVSASAPYAAKYTLTKGSGPCSEMKGDSIGMSAYNPANADGSAPDLSKASLAIRTLTLGSLVANAKANGVDDTTANQEPFAFGPFNNVFPDANHICTPTLAAAHQVLPAVPGDVGNPEDPDDDVIGQDATDITETWSNVQLYVTAETVGTQMKGHYTITDGACTAEYDAIAIFPSVSCEVDVPADATFDIASIKEVDTPLADGTRPVQIETTAPHGLSVGDLFEVDGVDDDAGTITYNSTYTVAAVASPTSIVTAELDPFGNDPDPEVDGKGTIVKLTPTGNVDLCSPVAIPDKGIATGSGISSDYPTKCDPDLFVCLIDADPKTAKFPVLKPGTDL